MSVEKIETLLDRLAERAPGGVLRHVIEREERDGLSWEETRPQGPEQIVRLLMVHRENSEPEMAELPEAWKTLQDETPAPKCVAAIETGASRDATSTAIGPKEEICRGNTPKAKRTCVR